MSKSERGHRASMQAEDAQLATGTTRDWARQDHEFARQWEAFNSHHWHDKMDLERSYEPAFDRERRDFSEKYGRERDDLLKKIQELEERSDQEDFSLDEFRQLKAYEQGIKNLDGYLNRKLDDHKTHHANAEAHRQSREYKRAEYIRQQQAEAIEARESVQRDVSNQKRENTPVANDDPKPAAWHRSASPAQDNRPTPDAGADFEKARSGGPDLGSDFRDSAEHDDLTLEESRDAYIRQELQSAYQDAHDGPSISSPSHSRDHKR